MLFAVAASQVLAELGLAEDLTQITSVLTIPKWLMVLIVGILVTLVAGPLSSTATLTAVGLVSFSALVSVGVDPVVAVVAILAFSSTRRRFPAGIRIDFHCFWSCRSQTGENVYTADSLLYAADRRNWLAHRNGNTSSIERRNI